MFKSEKEIPKTLYECRLTDNVSNVLWNWSINLESWSIIILIILSIIGIITSIVSGAKMSDYNDDLARTTTITSIITWALYAFIGYFSFKALSLLIAALSKIVESTCVTANVALYTAAKAEKASTEESTKPAPQSSYSKGPWTCKCGTTNDANSISCKDCGEYK